MPASIAFANVLFKAVSSAIETGGEGNAGLSVNPRMMVSVNARKSVFDLRRKARLMR